MSAPWVSGGRVSARVIEQRLAAALLSGRHDEAVSRATTRCVRAWRQAIESLGPASGATAVWRHVVQPIADALGWSPASDREARFAGLPVRVASASPGGEHVTLIATPWGSSQDGLQRAATRQGSLEASRWVAVTNGLTWRWYDATRPYAREHLALDLRHATADARVWQALWWLGQRQASRGQGHGALCLDRLIADAAREAAGEARALRDGVAQSMSALAPLVPGGHDAHVTQVFQWLFLLYADARGLRPRWHPAYRRSYAIATLAREARVDRRHRPECGHASARAALGVRDSLAAISCLARDGGLLGDLPVSALSGPLFADVPIARASRRATDATLGRVLEALTHGGDPSRGHPLDFSTLAVEHLGSVYEHLMAPAAPAGRPSLLRKRTGAFYTPRALADVLVQRTLEPLVRDATSSDILALRILDPAMGSGALLASAHRYLTEAVEAAWVREGRGGPLDVPRAEREALPRQIAERCLFGADINEHAVQVARLSIWLLSLAPDRPLTWLDAHLRVGNSLVGASPSLVIERPPTGTRMRRPQVDGQLALFDLSRWHHEAAAVGPLFEALSQQPTDSAADAMDKTRQLAALRGRSDLSAWRRRADAWCGAAMDAASTTAASRAIDAHLRAPDTRLPRDLAAQRDRWLEAARAHGCLHWSLEFPDVFDAGRGGFDAVIANPPWEMLRGDLGTAGDRAAHRDDLGPLRRFVERSGLYQGARGHVNSYQLFVERMLHLVRPGGRLGWLLPGSILADQGAAPLRTTLFEQSAVDRVSVVSNREGLFPIHRSMRVVALTASQGRRTDALVMDDGPDLTMHGDSGRERTPRLLTRELLRRAGGDAEPVPMISDAGELAVLERLLRSPALGSHPWGLRFGRELNATEDRGRFSSTPTPVALAVLDGKHVQAFTVTPPDDGPWIDESAALSALPAAPWRKWRLAYRDVSGAGNARSLIAALLPRGCVSTHTLFCLKTPPGLAQQLYLCGLMNSLPADWFVRRYLGSHVTTRLMARLPVPQPTSPALRRQVIALVLRLMRHPDDRDAAISLQVTAATLYGLDLTDMRVIVGDFPRLAAEVRDGILMRVGRL